MSILSVIFAVLNEKNFVLGFHAAFYIVFCCMIALVSYVKGKAIPLWSWTGPEGSRLRLPDFKTVGK
jgi:hypothetical protein